MLRLLKSLFTSAHDDQNPQSPPGSIDIEVDLPVTRSQIAREMTVLLESPGISPVAIKLPSFAVDRQGLRLPDVAPNGSAIIARIRIVSENQPHASVVSQAVDPLSISSATPSTSEAPYNAPDATNVHTAVTITVPSAFQMPLRCVTCDAPVLTLFPYVQDHWPLIGPGVGLVRTTQVALPYCDRHRKAFEFRFRKLRKAQSIAYAVFLPCTFTIFFPPLRVVFGWPSEPGLASGAFGGILFLLLVVTIFCIKPFLYDAFIYSSRKRIRIKSKSHRFLNNVIECNKDIAVWS